MAIFAAFSVLSSLVVLAFSVVLLRYYAHRGVSWVVSGVTLVCWALVFSNVYLVPLDIVVSQERDEKHPQHFLQEEDALFGVWNFVFWVAFFSTWLVVPLLQGYFEAGGFTPGQRLKESLKSNVKFYAIVGVLLLVFIIYIAVRNNFSWDQLVGFLVCLGNTWGLLLTVLMLGYGFIEVPRQLWHNADREVRLKEMQYTAANVFNDLEVAKDHVSEALRAVREVAGIVPAGNMVLQAQFSIIEESLPLEEELSLQDLVPIRESADAQELLERLSAKGPSMQSKDLAQLHFLVKSTVRDMVLLQHHWNEIVERAEQLEELIELENTDAQPPVSLGLFAKWWWIFRIRYRHKLYRGLSVLCIALSVLLVWCELTLYSSSDLSPFARMLEGVQGDHNATIVLSMIPLLYLLLCAYYSMFKLQLFSYYNMRGNHRTEENSLLLNASYMMRLMPPLTWNFLSMVRVDGTSFQQVVGKMQSVPFFGTDFNSYCPIIIIILCLMTYFNVFDRLMLLLGISRFQYSASYSDDLISEGIMLINKEKRQRARERRRVEDSATATGRRADRSAGRRRERQMLVDL